MTKYKLVPIEPTDDICEAAEQYLIDDGWDAEGVGELDISKLWDAMLEAAPDVGGEAVCEFHVIDGMLEPVYKDWIPEEGDKLYTYPPDAAKRIAELESQLHELRGSLLLRGNEIETLWNEKARLVDALNILNDALGTCQCEAPNYMAMAGREYYFDPLKVNTARNLYYSLLAEMEGK